MKLKILACAAALAAGAIASPWSLGAEESEVHPYVSEMYSYHVAVVIYTLQNYTIDSYSIDITRRELALLTSKDNARSLARSACSVSVGYFSGWTIRTMNTVSLETDICKVALPGPLRLL